MVILKLTQGLSAQIKINPPPFDSNVKISLFKAYITAHKFNIICLSETYAHCITQLCNTSLEIPGCNLICFDHPSNTKQGNISMYYTTSLPSRVINACLLQECVCFEVLCVMFNFVVLYRSPSQIKTNMILFAITLN